eukprot:XP_011680198.1 PREDICTED: GTPase Era, mitochondrial [Strongylocentrotus purpuratus]
MAASTGLTLWSKNLDISRNLSFAVKMMIGTLHRNPILHLKAICQPGQRSIWQSTIRSTVHKPTTEPTDQGPNSYLVDEGEREPEFYTPVPLESAEQQSLLLARPSCQPEDSRISRVTIVGTPNSGKSTLINSLLGRRICAVSQKVHTTMSKALAVITHKNTQVVLLDTPGLISYTQGRRHKLPRSLLVDAKNTFLESDLVAVLVMYLTHGPTIFVILNKVDAVKAKQSLVEITEVLTEGVVDGKEFVSPRRKGKFKDRIRESLNSERTEKRQGEEESEMGNDERNLVVSRLADSGVPRGGTESSSSPDNPSVRVNAMQQTSWSQTSVGEKDKSRLHVQDHDKFSKASSELSSTNPEGHTLGNGSRMTNHVTDGMSQVMELPKLDQIQGNEGHVTDHVTDDASKVTEGNTVQSHDLDMRKKDIMQQYTANLFELSDDGDRVVARQKREGHDEERMAMEKEEMEREQEERKRMWRMAKERSGWNGFKAVYMVSALHGDGVNDLKEFLVTNAKPGDWEYHEDVVTNLTPEEIVRDAIREKLLETLPQEVPYNISQSTELWRTGENGELHIVQILICHKKSHVRMLEKKLAWIGRQATQDLMDAFHCDVKLSLHVRFKK